MPSLEFGRQAHGVEQQAADSSAPGRDEFRHSDGVADRSGYSARRAIRIATTDVAQHARDQGGIGRAELAPPGQGPGTRGDVDGMHPERQKRSVAVTSERRSSESWRDAVTKARVRLVAGQIRMTVAAPRNVASMIEQPEVAIFSTRGEHRSGLNQPLTVRQRALGSSASSLILTRF